MSNSFYIIYMMFAGRTEGNGTVSRSKLVYVLMADELIQQPSCFLVIGLIVSMQTLLILVDHTGPFDLRQQYHVMFRKYKFHSDVLYKTICALVF